MTSPSPRAAPVTSADFVHGEPLQQKAGGVDGRIGVDEADDLEVDPRRVAVKRIRCVRSAARIKKFVPLEAHQDLRGSQRDGLGRISSTVNREMVRAVRAAATADIEYPGRGG